MKRFILLTFLAIGLLSVSVAIAKDREPVSVSINTGNSAGFDSIYSQLTINYVAEATNEVVLPYVDELVKPTLDGHKVDVFHPPVIGRNFT